MNKNILATILIVLAIGIYFTVTQGILADAGTIQLSNAQYQSAIQSADKLVAVRDQVLNDYNNLSQDDRDRLNKMLPTSVDNIRLIIDLNSVALRHGFTLQGIKASADSASQATAPTPTAPSPTPQPGSGTVIPQTIATPSLSTVSISFGLTGPYAQFISFMQDLEANLRIMDVTHLSISATDNGMYTFTVGLRTYWLSEQ